MDEETTGNKEIMRQDYKVVLLCQQPKCCLDCVGRCSRYVKKTWTRILI